MLLLTADIDASLAQTRNFPRMPYSPGTPGVEGIPRWAGRESDRGDYALDGRLDAHLSVGDPVHHSLAQADPAVLDDWVAAHVRPLRVFLCQPASNHLRLAR